jgi:hypothetical protein
MGSPRTNSSLELRRGMASSKLPSKRTFQAPFCPPARNKFHPCAVGTINTDVGPISISKLLPGDHVRVRADLSDHHLYHACRVT